MFINCIINAKKKNPNRGGSYIESSDWITITKGKINPINKKDSKCFQYAATVVIGKYAKRITKIKPFINKMGRNKFSIKKNMIGKK